MLISKEATNEEGVKAPCIGLAADALPAVQQSIMTEDLPTGVSTRNAPLPKDLLEVRRAARTPHWFALRTTYGREKKARDFFEAKNIPTFYPTLTKVKQIDGKRVTIIESRLPNILFVFGIEREIQLHVYDNVNLPFVRFYYCHIHKGHRIIRHPLIVPDNQIECLKIICAAEEEDVIVAMGDVPKFRKGQLVRITSGSFAGVEGRVARFQGQQRVAVHVEGLCTVITAYVPTSFLQPI